MTESAAIDVENTAPVAPAAPALTSGALLRQAREAQGLHIAAIAVALKVPVKKLEALEADRFDLLPDTVFVRGLASSVCRSLKVDPEPILQKLPRSTVPRLKDDGSGINVPFRSSGGGALRTLWDQHSLPLVAVATVLLAGALLLVFVPFDPAPDAAVGSKPAAVEAVATLPQPAPVAMASSPLPAPEPATPSATTEPGSAGAVVTGSGAVNGTVVFKAQALSWVEVVDGAGTVQVRRNIGVGETIGASGVLPLKVVVGRADTMQVLVRGQPFDLSSLARENVARFEVK